MESKASGAAPLTGCPDGKEDASKTGWPADSLVGKAKGDAFRMFSTMETVVAVATMAALAALPMTTLQSLCAIFCTETLNQAHRFITLRGAPALVELFPTGIMQFRALFCCWIAFSLLRFHRAQARFYQWFSQSDIAPARSRGFGYFSCRAFGFIPVPTLTLFQFHTSCIVMAICLVSAACPFNHPNVTRMFLFGALVMYILYFSQLFCESRAGGHSTIIIPLVLIHLICAGEAGHWSVLLLKLHIAFCYFSAGYGKIVGSVYFGTFWGNGGAQQYLFWESLWSRAGGIFSRTIQEFMFRRLWLNRCLASFTLLFQLSVPLAILDLRLSWFFFVLSFGFHASVLVTTNISFMPYWVPALLIFVFPHGAAPFDGCWASASFALTGAMEASPIGFCVVCFYLLVQAVVTFGLIDLTYGDVLPISCEPMFVLPRSINDQWPKLFIMTTANCREAGHLEPYVHCSFNPVSKIFPMDEKAMMSLPSRTLIFMTLNSIPPEVADLVQEDVKPTPFFVWSNVSVDKETMEMFAEIADILNDAEHPACRNSQKLEKLLELRRKVRASFDEACLEKPEATGFSSVGPATFDKVKPVAEVINEI